MNKPQTKWSATLWALVASCLLSAPSYCAGIGVTINAASFNLESKPADPNIIRNMGTKVGYIKSAGSIEYMGYQGLDLSGATQLTVRAASGGLGGTLRVALVDRKSVV